MKEWVEFSQFPSAKQMSSLKKYFRCSTTKELCAFYDFFENYMKFRSATIKGKNLLYTIYGSDFVYSEQYFVK